MEDWDLLADCDTETVAVVEPPEEKLILRPVLPRKKWAVKMYWARSTPSVPSTDPSATWVCVPLVKIVVSHQQQQQTEETFSWKKYN